MTAQSTPKEGEDGFALVVVLWFLVLLAAFVGPFALAARTSAISGAMRLHLIEQDPERRFFLEGDRSAIRFNGLTPHGMSGYRLREIGIALRGTAEEGELIQTVAARRYSAEIRQAARNTELLANRIIRLEFRYLPHEAEARWQNSWRETADLPRAVEISLTARRGDRDLTITTRALLPLTAKTAGGRG